MDSTHNTPGWMSYIYCVCDCLNCERPTVIKYYKPSANILEIYSAFQISVKKQRTSIFRTKPLANHSSCRWPWPGQSSSLPFIEPREHRETNLHSYQGTEATPEEAGHTFPQPKTFMSDCYEGSHRAVLRVLADKEELLCTFHVVRAWRANPFRVSAVQEGPTGGGQTRGCPAGSTRHRRRMGAGGVGCEEEAMAMVTRAATALVKELVLFEPTRAYGQNLRTEWLPDTKVQWAAAFRTDRPTDRKTSLKVGTAS